MNNNRHLPLNIYVASICTITVVAFFLIVQIQTEYHFIFINYFIWILLVVIAELVPIILPRGKASLSVGGAIDFGIILLFPTIFAAFAGVISGLVSSISRKVEMRKAVFNVSMSSLTLIIPSEIIRIFGVKISSFQTFDLSSWPLTSVFFPCLLAAMAYFLLNTGLTSIAISLDSKGNIFDIWRTNYMWTIASSVATAAIGFVLASMYHVLSSANAILGILGLCVFIMPLIVIRSSFISFMNVNRAYFGSIRALVSALDASHHYTQGHSRRVAENAVKVAKRMKLSTKVVETVEQGAILHDLGKIGMDNSVLDKKGPLTGVEWARMKRHPILGSHIIDDLSFLVEAKEIVLHHHERIDGKGYPSKLIGHDIPLGARIVNAVDALDALTSERSYRNALSPQQAITILDENSGKQFDEEVVLIIKRLFETGELAFQDTATQQEAEILFTAREVMDTLQMV